jgi:hypothetical protein
MRMVVIDGNNKVANIIEADLTFEVPGCTLVPYQAPAYIGGTYTNGVFSAPPAPPAVTPTVPKSTVMARVTAAGKMSQAQSNLWAAPDQFAKWFAPDQPVVNCNDPATVAFVQALGLDPNVILAPAS